MAAVIDGDVVEQILLRLEAKDLISFKRVCKSWHSFITSPRFISRHLNHSYNRDHSNNQLGHRRISVFSNHHRLIGSSNGLVCICCSRSNLIVHNPITREVRQLPYPPYICRPLCWGFGYDSVRDDYKVIVGARKDEKQTCFRLLSLKTNVWRDAGEEKCSWFVNEVGILCNGALHWIVVDQNQKMLIISYVLSNEEFKEIPQPDHDARYNCSWSSYPGIMKGCFCVFGYGCGAWLMKRYDVKESWELVDIPFDDMKKYDIVHTLRLGYPFVDDLKPYCSSKHPCWEYPGALIFVESLVSPHVSKESKSDLIVSVLNKKVEVVKEFVADLCKRKDLELEERLIGEIQEKQSIEHTCEVVENPRELEESLKEHIEVGRESDMIEKRNLIDPTWENNQTMPTTSAYSVKSLWWELDNLDQ